MKKEKIFIWKDGKVMIDGVYAAKFYRERGIDPGILAGEIDKIMPPGSFARHKAIAEAYDEAHGTKTADKIKDVFDKANNLGLLKEE